MRDKKYDIIYMFKILLVCLAFCMIIFMLCASFDFVCKKTYVEVIEEINSISVVIDAGHGGRDGGASDELGTLEKDLNLSVSNTLKYVLRLCGIKVIMTRESDSLVCDETDPQLKGKLKMTDLSNRLKIAEENPTSAFVSIHMNKFSIEKYKGLQVYYSSNNDASFELAKSIQEKTVAVLQPDNTRKVKKAGSSIFLLDRITVPAVLVECGFLSNNEEAERLRNPLYQTQLAMVISDSILTNISMAGNN